MTNQQLAEIASRIVELQTFTKKTGTKTGRTQGELTRALDPVELSIVASLVNQKLYEREHEERKRCNINP